MGRVAPPGASHGREGAPGQDGQNENDGPAGPAGLESRGRGLRRAGRGRQWLAAFAVVCLAVSAGLVGWAFLHRKEPGPPGAGQRAPRSYPRFAPGNVYDVDLSSAPLDAKSATMVRGLAAAVRSRYNGVATVNAYADGVQLFVSTPDTPKVQVVYRDCGRRGYVPDGLYDGRRHFVDVPIPLDAEPMPGDDGQLSVWAPHEDRLWEFWVARKRGDTWEACWGGRVDRVSENAGRFEPPFGVNASGLVMSGSMISVQEAQAGRIEHAMGLAIPQPANYFVYPAQRTDGVDSSPAAIPEGARLRLDPALDVDTLGLTPLAAAIARAAQTYGFIVTDRSGGVSVICEGGTAEAQRTGADPWQEVLQGTPPYEVMRGFPWDRMQVVELGYGRPPG